jgi:Tol biopolymer transport system component
MRPFRPFRPFRAFLAMILLVGATAGIVTTASAAAPEPGTWGPAVRVEDQPDTHPEFNTSVLDGCPFIAPDGLTFFMASARTVGSAGGIDIWISTRPTPDAPWGEPVNAGAPINTEHNDFCPTMSRDGHTFYFASNRPGFCGGDDIFTARRRADGWTDVTNLGCDTDGGPNSSANEASPFPSPVTGSLFLSSTRSGNSDIFQAPFHAGRYGLAEPVAELNTAAQDGHPNLSRDGRELYFFSTRAGNSDIYVATRSRITEPFSTIDDVEQANSPSAESRPSLSWDGATLYFGSDRPGGDGGADHYVITRQVHPGG